MKTSHRPPTDVIDAVESLLDASLQRHYDQRADETFLECHACGGWEEHKRGCFVPVLQKWQNAK